MDHIAQLEEAIFAALELGKKITVQWDCGGDEAIITSFIDGEQLMYNNSFARELDMYLINFLHLPDTGPFSMVGKGTVVLKDNEIYLEYESIMIGMEDFETGGWKELNARDPNFSGMKKLFK